MRQRRPASGTRVKALAYVVDDSALVCDLLTEALSDAGFEVVTAQSTIGLRARLIRDRPDVLVLDVHVPPFQAPEVIALIRAHTALQSLPILLISSMDVGELRVLALSCGVDSFATKDDPQVIALRAAGLLLRRGDEKTKKGGA
jgi:DNA-binding response OmpR family regulator